MAKVKIDNKEYETDDFTAELNAQITSLKYVDAELRRLQAQMAVMQPHGRSIVTPSENHWKGSVLLTLVTSS